MPKVTGLSHVVLYVNDLDKMVKFYTDVLGLTIHKQYPGRGVFMTSNPEVEDHELAMFVGREGDAKLLAHTAWHVPTPADVKAFYDRSKASGIPIDHTVSHDYVTMGCTVSCYLVDPEGNRVEVFALVDEADPEHRGNRPLDMDRSLEDIIAQASGRVPAPTH